MLHNVHVFDELDNSAVPTCRLSKNMKTMPDQVTFQEKIVFKSKSVFSSLEATVNVFLGASFQGISIVL